MPNSWEILHFGDYTADAESDADGDALLNTQEYLTGNSPNLGDSDSDGTPDLVEAKGTVTIEYYDGISGQSVTDLTAHASFPDSPTQRLYRTLMEGVQSFGDIYGSRMRAYLEAPVTGDYKFWIASDDSSELWLGSTANYGTKALIASVTGWTGYRDWVKYASQESGLISLEAGKQYYIEALHKEGQGLDHISIAWRIPGGSIEVILGAYLSPFNRFGFNSPKLASFLIHKV